MTHKIIGRNLRTLRKSLNLSQQQVAESIGLSHHSIISLWESGERPISLGNLQRLAEIFLVDMDILFEETNQIRWSVFFARKGAGKPARETH